jgi:hypothetical protein
MKTKTATHTPGPWKQEGDAIWADHQNGSRLICRMKGLYRVPDTFDADARLISAAPEILNSAKEMLELLNGAEFYEGSPISETKEYKNLSVAIAKAEGR